MGNLRQHRRPNRALRTRPPAAQHVGPASQRLAALQYLADRSPALAVLQRVQLDSKRLNVVGETHPVTDKREEQERDYAKEETGSTYYVRENGFQVPVGEGDDWRMLYGDDRALRVESWAALLDEARAKFGGDAKDSANWHGWLDMTVSRTRSWSSEADSVLRLRQNDSTASALGMDAGDLGGKDAEAIAAIEAVEGELNRLLGKTVRKLIVGPQVKLSKDERQGLVGLIAQAVAAVKDVVLAREQLRSFAELSTMRSDHMHQIANVGQHAGKKGVWKIGDKHVEDIQGYDEKPTYHLLDEKQFDEHLLPWMKANKKRYKK